MIDELSIENLGLIDSVALSLRPGLVVVTGETGTGKTVFVGGLRLLLGQTARKDSVGPHGDAAVVEGRFVLGDEEVVGKRVITSSRSRAYLNGSMATADQLSERLGPHVDIVAQHDQLTLRNPTEIRALVDAHLDETGRAASADYRASYQRWSELRRTADALGGDRRALERELELAAFQAEEITAAALSSGEETELVDEVSRMRHREELLERFDRARGEVETAREALGVALDDLRRAARLDQSAGETTELLAAVSSELAEVDGNIRVLAEDLPHDPDRLESLESRLSLINDLKRKYGDSIEDVIAFGKAAAARAVELGDLLGRADTLAADIQKAGETVAANGARLREARRAAALALTGAAVGHLRDTGMTAPVLTVEIEEADAGPNGADRCELLFASDERLDPMPVQRVASGGELSRLVLALRLASGSAETPVLVFDEVDAGVGGETGLAVGRKLAKLAESGQVVCVTHLPQVAACADQHLVVERNGTTSTVREVAPADRPIELARMLSGMSDSDDAQRHAAELLDRARVAER